MKYPIGIQTFEKITAQLQEALSQINQKGYAREYDSDPRKLYKIGCNFSTQTGTISDWIVEGR